MATKTIRTCLAGIEEAVGGTPLVPLRRSEGSRTGAGEVPRGPVHASVWVKLEAMNPGGSVKDRPALAIVEEAERTGRLGPGRTLLDASSGNTGIAYALFCAARGIECEICIPRNASEARRRLLRAYGARVVLTDPAEGPNGAVREARLRAETDPDRYFYANQYDNPTNPRAHYEGTGPEIVAQTRGELTHFVAAVGTSGTLMGVGRRLRERVPGVRLVGVQPDGPFHGIEGVKHLESARWPGIYEPELVDEVIAVSTEAAQATARELARKEGLFTGVSGGANVRAALLVARREPDAGPVVTVLPDGGERYLGEGWVAGT